jgi:hypothetical protein
MELDFQPNRKQALKNCLDNEKLLDILRINKIRRPRFVVLGPDNVYPLIGKYYDSNRQTYEVLTNYEKALKSSADFFVEYISTLHKYNVYLFDMDVFLLMKKIPFRTTTHDNSDQPKWLYEEIPVDFDEFTQKICHLAKRAVYIMGLDFCMVHMAIDVRGRPVVLDLLPMPVLSPEAAKLFREKVDSFISQESSTAPVTPVLLGTDPEFMLRDIETHSIKYPSQFLTKEGPIGYDERSENRAGTLFPLAEIRPRPDFCPIKLTDKIRDLLRQITNLIPEHIEWLAGSMPFEHYQIGGHIHFSNIRLSSRLLRALDNYLAIPVMLIENPITAVLRRKQYGWLGSVRDKSHGGFEYRVPGSWLISPELTRACLCLAKIIASEFPSLSRDYFIDPELQKAFYLSKKHLFYDIFAELWSDISKTSLYNQYAEYLTPFPQLISSRSHWDEETDLRKSWELMP